MAQPARPPICLGSVRLMRDAPLGSGAYGQVCRTMLGELPCAAKLLHAILLDPSNPRNKTLFERECRFLSQVRHPNIVQYLGVMEDEESGLPILLMELMDSSLTHFLAESKESLAYYVQVNISHDIAVAVAFLHLNGIVHRDLSSSNVLLIGAGSRAKVTDFGMSKLTELTGPHTTELTKCPGNPAYMSPEALVDPPVYTEKLDCFQVGVLMLQVMTCKYPSPGGAMNRVRDTKSHTGWKIEPIPELQRRDNHLRLVAKTHPMLCLVKECLKDTDTERPLAQRICQCLSDLKKAPRYRHSLEARGCEREEGDSKEEGRSEKKEREELIRQLRDKNQARERGEVREKERELKNLRSEVQVKEGNIESLKGAVYKKQKEVGALLEENEALKCVIQEREEEVRVKSEAIQELQRLLQDKNQTIIQLQQTQQLVPSRTYLVSGPGLQSASANHPTHVVVKLSDSSGSPCSLEQNVTVELVLQSTSSQATSVSHAQQLSAAVTMISPSRYEVSYTAARRGQHKLHVRVNGSEINGSPFKVTIYRDPVQLGSPVRVLKANKPYGIAINNCGEMIVTEWYNHKVAVFDDRGQSVRTFSGSHGGGTKQMKYPQGIAVDDADNIYVSSLHKLQKFSSSGDLIKCIGREGIKNGEFNDPRGVTIHSNQVYVCDADNHRIQVFDLELNFIRSIGSFGSGRREFNRPLDVAVNNAGNMYVVEFDNSRVQVMDSSGEFIKTFGQEGMGKLSHPTALHIADKYAYVSDWSSHRIAVYTTSGQYVTSFGRQGQGEGEFNSPFCITSCINGYIYVCDSINQRVQVF